MRFALPIVEKAVNKSDSDTALFGRKPPRQKDFCQKSDGGKRHGPGADGAANRIDQQSI